MPVTDKCLLILDETDLEKGNLNEVGVQNVNYIKKVIEYQTLNLEYPYNAGVQIDVNCSVLILSKSKSFFHGYSEKMKLVKYEGNLNSKNLELENHKIKECKEYIKVANLLKDLESFNDKFIIEDETSKKLQTYFIEKRKNYPDYNPEEFSCKINLAKLYSRSKGCSKLTYEDFLYVDVL